MRLAILAALILFATPALAGPAAARLNAAGAEVDAIARRVMQDQNAPPGLAIVIAARGEAPVILTYGARNIATGARVDADTPIYIASMTKAYVGVLAADLERTGVFDLDAPLGSAWPALSGPLAQVRFRDWMAHVAPFENEALGFRTGYVAGVTEPLFGQLLADYTTPRAAGFEYSNDGYLIYRAALEAHGRPLTERIESRLFRPLGLARTSMRTSEFSPREIAVGHVRDAAGAWRAVPPKTDDLMHAAGGIFSSPRDMGRWLSVNIDPDTAGELSPAIREAQSKQSDYTGDRRGLACDGYGLGWYRCDYGGVRVLSHGGGYTGFGSLITVAPDAGFGVAILANGDSAGQTFTSDLTKAALDAWAGRHPGADVAERLTAFLDAQAVRETAQIAKRRADPAFAGWAWRPDAGALASFAGRYESPRLGMLTVKTDGKALAAVLGALVFELEPAAPGVFGATSPGSLRPDVFRFERGPDGRIAALLWGERRFDRR